MEVEENKVLTKTKIKELLQQDFELGGHEKQLTQKQKLEIRYNIWYKLYKLQNYNITPDMFLGSYMRWQSIINYHCFIKAYYTGKLIPEKSRGVYTPSLLKYVQGLMDSGEEPFELPEAISEFSRDITIQDLLDLDIITTNDARFIYSGVGITQETPDTSISCTKRGSSHIIDGTLEHSIYANIVDEITDTNTKIQVLHNVTTNPVKNIDYVNPFRFKKQTNKDFNYLDSIQQIFRFVGR